jgi:hypothetical protein
MYRKTPYLVPRIKHGNKFFSKLFIRGLKFINKVLLKSFYTVKILDPPLSKGGNGLRNINSYWHRMHHDSQKITKWTKICPIFYPDSDSSSNLIW